MIRCQKNNNDNVYTPREYRKFFIVIPIKYEDKYKLKNKKHEITDKKGIIV